MFPSLDCSPSCCLIEEFMRHLANTMSRSRSTPKLPMRPDITRACISCSRGAVGALSMRRRIWLAWSRWPHLTRQTHSSRATWVCEAQGGEEEVTGHTPHVTRHASQVTSHASHVTCHMSYLHVVCPDAVEPQLHHAITVPGSKCYKETLKVLQRNAKNATTKTNAENATKNAARECTAPHSS